MATGTNCNYKVGSEALNPRLHRHPPKAVGVRPQAEPRLDRRVGNNSIIHISPLSRSRRRRWHVRTAASAVRIVTLIRIQIDNEQWSDVGRLMALQLHKNQLRRSFLLSFV